MAILGNGGVLEISREVPNAMALSWQRLNIGSTPYTITFASPSYWPGDRIILAADGGLPIDLNGDGYADCPDGHGIYRGSIWQTGPSRAFYTGSDTDASPWYDEVNEFIELVTQNGDNLITQSGDTIFAVLGDDSDFYNTAATTGLTEQTDAYMSRDVLDRIRLWTTEQAGHAGVGTEKELINVKPKNLVVAKYSADSAYVAAIDSAIASIADLTINGEVKLSGLITLPDGFHVVCQDENREWKIQCDLEEWILSIDADNLDITAIGQTFGESVKALVRGAGSLQFFADHRQIDVQQDSLAILRLVLLTQNQCNTKAKFYLYEDREVTGNQIKGSVYYEFELLLTNTRLNTRPTEVIEGTADFVATSEIELRALA